MRKRADLGQKTLFWTNWCSLLKIAKKWSAQCEVVKMCWSRAKNAVLNKPMPFAENDKTWCAQNENDKTYWSRSENAFCSNSSILLKIANKWCAQCVSYQTCWSRANNAVLLFGQTRAICWKELKGGPHSAKMLKRADLGLKTLFCTNSCTLLKRVKKWWTQCKNDSTCWSRSENTVLYKLVHVAEKS